jgi:hypothetical protein
VDALTIEWFADSHPCDGTLYMAVLGFVKQSDGA